MKEICFNSWDYLGNVFIMFLEMMQFWPDITEWQVLLFIHLFMKGSAFLHWKP